MKEQKDQQTNALFQYKSPEMEDGNVRCEHRYHEVRGQGSHRRMLRNRCNMGFKCGFKNKNEGNCPMVV